MDFKVKCTGYHYNDASQGFTIGKVYDVVDGKIVSDSGEVFHTWSAAVLGRSANFESLKRWFDMWYDFELVTECKFKVGDTVIGNHPSRYSYTKKGWIGEVRKVHSDGCIDVYGKRATCNEYMTFTFLEPQYFDLYTPKSEKIVITHDGKTTTATLYREDGSKEVATAKCSPEDTFDFNVGAKLAMERLMKKIEPPIPVKEWRVVDRKAKVGDYIRLKTDGHYHWNKPGDILKVDDVGYRSLVMVYGKNHLRPTANSETAWNYILPEYEVVEPVTATEPPKYYSGKVVCIYSDSPDWWTVGKVYEFVDGVTFDDEGDERFDLDPIIDITKLKHRFIPLAK